MYKSNLYLQIADDYAGVADEIEAEIATFRQIVRRFKGKLIKVEALEIIEELTKQKGDWLCRREYYLSIGSKLAALLKKTEAEENQSLQPA